MEELKNWLVVVIKGIIVRPNEMDIQMKKDDMGVLFILKVHFEDRGRVIGKKGQHANAIRTLLRCAGSKLNTRVSLIIQTDENPATSVQNTGQPMRIVEENERGGVAAS